MDVADTLIIAAVFIVSAAFIVGQYSLVSSQPTFASRLLEVMATAQPGDRYVVRVAAGDEIVVKAGGRCQVESTASLIDETYAERVFNITVSRSGRLYVYTLPLPCTTAPEGRLVLGSGYVNVEVERMGGMLVIRRA